MITSTPTQLRASLAATFLLASVTLAACGAHRSATPIAATGATIPTIAAASATQPLVASAVTSTPARGSAATPAGAASPASSAAQTAAIGQDLNGISNELAVANQDLQAGPTQQTIDPRG